LGCHRIGKATKTAKRQKRPVQRMSIRKNKSDTAEGLEKGTGYQRTADGVYAQLNGKVSFRMLESSYAIRETAIKGYKVVSIGINYSLSISAELDRALWRGRFLEGVLLRGRLLLDNTNEIGTDNEVG
jgi:hypothetical protein